MIRYDYTVRLILTTAKERRTRRKQKIWVYEVKKTSNKKLPLFSVFVFCVFLLLPQRSVLPYKIFTSRFLLIQVRAAVRAGTGDSQRLVAVVLSFLKLYSHKCHGENNILLFSQLPSPVKFRGSVWNGTTGSLPRTF